LNHFTFKSLSIPALDVGLNEKFLTMGAAEGITGTDFLRLLAVFGSVTIVLTLLVGRFLDKIGFRFERIPSFIARQTHLPFLKTPNFAYHLRWMSVVIAILCLSPIIVLVVHSAVVVHTLTPSIIGYIILCFGLFLYALLFGMFRWRHDRWSLNKSTKLAFGGAFVCFSTFQILTVLIKPYSFYSISAVFLVFNLVPLVYITFQLAPGARVDFHKFMQERIAASTGNSQWGTKKNTGPTGTTGRSHNRASMMMFMSMPTGIYDRCAVLYAVSLFILGAYSVCIWMLLDESWSRLGLVVSGSCMLIDLTTALYTRLSWRAKEDMLTPRTVINILALSRLVFIFSAQYWFLGLAGIYLVFGLVIAVRVIDKRIGFGQGTEAVELTKILETLTAIEKGIAQKQAAAAAATVSASNGGAEDSSVVVNKGVNRNEIEDDDDMHQSFMHMFTGKSNLVAFASGSRISNAPEGILLLFTFGFSLFFIIARVVKPHGVPLTKVNLWGSTEDQFLFGLFAFLLLVNGSFVSCTIATYMNESWSMNKRRFLCFDCFFFLSF